MPASSNPIIGNADRAQIFVRMFVLSCKKSRALSDVIANWTAGDNLNASFFKNQSDAFAPTGRYADMLHRVNHDLFTTHSDKVYKLDRNWGFFPDPTSTSGAATQKPVSKEFSINLKVKNKILKYESSLDQQPTNYQPWVMCMFAYGNGAAPSTVEVPFIAPFRSNQIIADKWDKLKYLVIL